MLEQKNIAKKEQTSANRIQIHQLSDQFNTKKSICTTQYDDQQKQVNTASTFTCLLKSYNWAHSLPS